MSRCTSTVEKYLTLNLCYLKLNHSLYQHLCYLSLTACFPFHLHLIFLDRLSLIYSFSLPGRDGLGHGLNFLNACKVGKASVRAGAGAELLIFHLPFGVLEGQLVISDPRGSCKTVSRVEVFVERVLGSVLAGARNVKSARAEAVLGFGNGEFGLGLLE